MSEGLIISVIINLLVAFYFIYVFPRNLAKKLPQMPPFFKFLHRVIPIVGLLLIIVTLSLIPWDLLEPEPLL